MCQECCMVVVENSRHGRKAVGVVRCCVNWLRLSGVMGQVFHSKAYSTATEQASLAVTSVPCCRRLCSESNDASHAGQEWSPSEETLDGARDRERFDDWDEVSASSSDNLRFSDDGSVGSESVALRCAEKFSRQARMRFMRRE